MEILGIILAIVCIIAGFAGIFVPYLPDAPLVFAAVLLYWGFNGFEDVSLWVIAIELLLMTIIVVADFLAGTYGVKRLGGSKQAQIFSFIGGLIGLFFGNLVGLVAGTLIGAVFGELINEGDLKKSLKIGFASVLGFLGGVLFKIIMLVIMVGVFVVEVVF